jgi:VanZ family protein
VPSRHDLSDVQDVSVNILGFIPFGALLTIYLQQTRQWSKTWLVLTVLLAGTMISFTIELLQVYLPGRDSSFLDLINNALGTSIGSVVGVAIGRRT